MLIEAARGGHTSVVNLLLRQPLMKRRQQLDQASSLSNENRKLSRKHAPSAVTAAVASTTTATQQGKPLTSTLQHITPEQTLPASQVQTTPDTPTCVPTSQQPSSTSSSGSTAPIAGNFGSSGHLQPHAKMKVTQKPVKRQSLPQQQQQQQQQQGQGVGKEGGSQQQQQQLLSDAPDKASKASSAPSSRKVSQGSVGSSGGEGRDLIGAKRPKMSSTDPSLLATQSTPMTTPTKQPLVDADLAYLVTPPPAPDIPSAFSPGHYTTDSATALKNMERLTSNTNSPLKSGTIPPSEIGTSVDVPSLLQSHAQMVNSAHSEVTLPHPQLTPDDIIQGHMTADDIIARYWRQQNISDTPKHSQAITAVPSSVGEGKTNGAKESVGDSGAQSMFSSRNFSSLATPPPSGQGGSGYHASQFHSSSSASASGMPAAASQSLLINSAATGDHSNNSSNITQAPGVDSHPVSNMDLTRLIPHLEALAGSLHTNPTSLESRYLAALAAQSQLIHPPISSEDNSVDLPPDFGDGKSSLPASIGALDPAAEIAKLLPTIANFESQSDAAEFPAMSSSTGPLSQPIYPTDLSTLRHLSQKLQGHALDSEMGPDLGGGAEEEESELDVDLLQQNPARSLPPSLLLDNKFPLDIPPPNDLIPPENVSKTTTCSQ